MLFVYMLTAELQIVSAADQYQPEKSAMLKEKSGMLKDL